MAGFTGSSIGVGARSAGMVSGKKIEGGGGGLSDLLGNLGGALTSDNRGTKNQDLFAQENALAEDFLRG